MYRREWTFEIVAFLVLLVVACAVSYSIGAKSAADARMVSKLQKDLALANEEITGLGKIIDRQNAELVDVYKNWTPPAPLQGEKKGGRRRRRTRQAWARTLYCPGTGMIDWSSFHGDGGQLAARGAHPTGRYVEGLQEVVVDGIVFDEGNNAAFDCFDGGGSYPVMVRLPLEAQVEYSM